jgi:uncharacterized RDD family membrane protein YckC
MLTACAFRVLFFRGMPLRTSYNQRIDSRPASVLPPLHAGFWLRFLAAIVDFILLALPVGVAVSFYSLFRQTPLEFLKLHPGESRAEIIQSFGATFLYLLLLGFVLFSWLYFAISESSAKQATLGKRFLGLYVSGEDGHPVTFARASTRFFSGRLLAHVPALGGLYFIVDCLFAAVPPTKQALHDRIARCLVLKKDGF